MTPSSELFELIKSLSASEKRHFKLNADLQKGNKNYIRLFKIIDAQKSYDEKQIKTKFRNENFVKNLTFTKNYLYKLIFKSLISLYNQKSLDARLNNILSRCRLMYDKALYSQYFKTLQYGKGLAVKYERFSILLEFLEMERQLSKKEDITRKNINDVYDEELNVLEKIRINNKYKRSISGLFRIYRLHGIIRNSSAAEQINNILRSEEFSIEKKFLSVTAKEKYFFAMNIASELKGNSREAYNFNKKRFEHIFKNKEVFQQFLFDNYKDSYIALIHSAVQDLRFAVAKRMFEKFNKTFNSVGVFNTDTAATYYIITLSHAVSSENKKIKTFLPDSIEKFLVKNKGKVTINQYNYLYYLLAKYFFIIGEFDEALRIINFLFAVKTLKFTIHLEPYARMLNALVHYELGNKKLLNYLIPSTVKYLKSKSKLYKTENAVLSSLKKLNNFKTEEDLLKIFSLLKKNLLVFKKDIYEKNAFVYFDFLKWADNKRIVNSE
ncbi:MAG: hypothetical protein ABIY50_10130 [Ignavibacteria bacterium]